MTHNLHKGVLIKLILTMSLIRVKISHHFPSVTSRKRQLRFLSVRTVLYRIISFYHHVLKALFCKKVLKISLFSLKSKNLGFGGSIGVAWIFSLSIVFESVK